MAIPTLITELSTTAAANSPAGSDSPSTLDDIQRAHASFIAQLRDADALKLNASAVSAFGLTLMDDVSAAAARTTLGVTPANIGAAVAGPLAASGITGAAASGANTDITSLANIASINGGQLAGLRNLLINGNLAINQRAYVSGTATGAANQYTLDRWRVVTSGQALTFTASGNGNQMTAPAGGVEQVIEGANIGGGTYVLGWTGTATATVNGTARAKGESFTLPANTNATVRLIGGAASLVQLEPGGTVTPFEHRPSGMELALCHRYYYRDFPAATNRTFAEGFASSATVAFGVARFPIPMRSAPSTLEQSGTAGNYMIATQATSVVCSAVPVIINASASGCNVQFTVGTGLTAGNGVQFRTEVTTGALAYLGWSAEL